MLKVLYGTREASRLWQDHYSKVLCDNGWLRGKIFPATFYHALHDVRLACHGDDFICEGTDKGIDELETVMRSNFEAKAEGRIGPNGDKKGSFLKRDIEWDDEKKQFIWRNDLKLVMNLCDGLGLAKSKGCPTAATRGVKTKDADELLSPEEKSELNSVAGSLQYIALDRPDIQYTVKSLKKEASAPTRGSQGRMTRIVKYLAQKPCVD